MSRLRRQDTFIVSETTSHYASSNLSSDEEKIIETTSNPEYVFNKEYGDVKGTDDDTSDVSDRSDATYVKEEETNEAAVKKATSPNENKPNPVLKCKNLKISPVRPRSCNGILDPSDHDKRKAQWLSYGSPSFTSSRRRGSYDQRIAKPPAKEEPKSDKKANLACFKRSLKLLGIHPEDFDGFRQDVNRNDAFNPRATPTFSTQLKRRSVSLTSLRNAVQESGVPSEEAIDQLQREILAKAVYEEWYFKKLAEDRIKKEMDEKRERKKKDEMEKSKAEQRQKAEEYYNKWKQMKSESKKNDTKVLTKPRSLRNMPAYSVSQSKADEAFYTWKTEKDKALQVKVSESEKDQKEKKEKEKKAKEEKRSSAEAAYKAWKQQIDENLREKAREKERKLKDAEEKKRKEMQDKRENARTSFNAWKKMKDSEVKQKLRDKRLASERACNVKTVVQVEKLYEAEQAFEEWMDQVEERRKAQKMAVLKRKGKSNPPPWSPGGSFCH